MKLELLQSLGTWEIAEVLFNPWAFETAISDKPTFNIDTDASIMSVREFIMQGTWPTWDCSAMAQVLRARWHRIQLLVLRCQGLANGILGSECLVHTVQAIPARSIGLLSRKHCDP